MPDFPSLQHPPIDSPYWDSLESITVTGQAVAARVSFSPTAWRLGRRNGELVLQAGSIWHQGTEAGMEWNDVPIVDLDNEAQS